MDIYLVATLVYPECLGLFYLKAFRALGHSVLVWDPRTMKEPKLKSNPDLTVVIKEFVHPRTLPRPRVYIFPDQVKHENYSSYLNVLTPHYDDIFFCMKHNASTMRRYRARLLPFAFDKQFRRSSISTPKTIDVSFVGTNRPGRIKLIKYLIEHNVNIEIWGNSWPKETPNYMGEAIYLDDKRYVYNSSKIVLNIHYLVGVNMRFFEALGNRCFMLSDKVDGIEELGFKDGTHYVSYEDSKSLVAKIQEYLEQPLKREKIASQGYNLVKEKHTYIQRVNELLTEVLE